MQGRAGSPDERRRLRQELAGGLELSVPALAGLRPRCKGGGRLPLLDMPREACVSLLAFALGTALSLDLAGPTERARLSKKHHERSAHAPRCG